MCTLEVSLFFCSNLCEKLDEVSILGQGAGEVTGAGGGVLGALEQHHGAPLQLVVGEGLADPLLELPLQLLPRHEGEAEQLDAGCAQLPPHGECHLEAVLEGGGLLGGEAHHVGNDALVGLEEVLEEGPVPPGHHREQVQQLLPPPLGGHALTGQELRPAGQELADIQKALGSAGPPLSEKLEEKSS